MEDVCDSPKVNVWCCIMSDRIVGPFFFFHESTITSAVYLVMLENFVFPQIAEVDGLIFQQDGAPPHIGAIVRTALDERFPGRWIGRGGRLIGPHRVLTHPPMDFFWGYIKDIVSSERVGSLPDLCRRIAAAIAAVPVDVLSWVWGEVEFCFDVCRVVNGAHIELH
jgi:hypothetical protein